MRREQLLRRNVKRFRGGLVPKAHRLLYHSTLGLRVIKKKKRRETHHLAWRSAQKNEALDFETRVRRGTHHSRRRRPVFKAHRWLYHSTLGSRVIKKKRRGTCPTHASLVRRARLRDPRYRAVGPSRGSDVIPRRARPGLAGLRPHTVDPLWHRGLPHAAEIQGYLAHTKPPHPSTLQ